MKYYQAEMHCHIKDTSPCSILSAQEMVDLYIKGGYGYLFVTDHMHEAVTEKDELIGTSWEKRVDYFLQGYRKAKQYAKNKPIKVILAMEVTLKGKSPVDFLVYGADEEFIYNHPFFYYKEYGEFYEFVKKHGFLSFQAHPYRYGGAPIEPICYDGIEIYNSHPTHVTHNKWAVNYAQKHNLYTISGGDVHAKEHACRAGIMLPEGIESGMDLVEYYKSHGSPDIIITLDKTAQNNID